MTLVSNVYLTHGLMLLCACAATYAALPESTGRIVPEWRPAVTPLLAAMAALSLIAYPTWGELKNPPRQSVAARRRRIVVMQPADCSRPAGRVGLSGRTLCAGAYLRR